MDARARLRRRSLARRVLLPALLSLGVLAGLMLAPPRGGRGLAAEGSAAGAAAPKLSLEEVEAADEDCLVCHEGMDPGDAHFAFPGGRSRDFTVDPAALRASVHGRSQSCLMCHEGYGGDEHPAFPRDSERAWLEAKSAMCARCHEPQAEPRHPASADVSKGALCADCHRAHEDRAAKDEVAAMSRRCGDCHAKELDGFLQGGHETAIAEKGANPDLPSCATCHPPHDGGAAIAGLPAQGRPEADTDTRMAATARCIQCHSQELLILKYELPAGAAASYREDFHGMTFQHLWSQPPGKKEPEVMVCADCHGPHKVRALDPSQLAQVCARCHEASDPKLAGAWLGHAPLGPGHGGLVWAVRAAYYLLIPLIVLGLFIHIGLNALHERRLRRAGGAQARHETGVRGAPGGPGALPAFVVRFRPVERFEHLLVVLTFSTLVLTGLPQSYPASGLGRWIIDAFGGIESTRWVHRATGWAFATLLVLHVLRGAIGALRSRRLPDMVPTKRDFLDLVQHVKHCLGQAEAPSFGRFDFREKFEYWGMFFGSALMAATGMMLIYPELATRILPGVVLAAARVAHGLEATLAVLVVLVWHLWSVSLRREVFPCDTSIFTGKMPVERLREEHPREYEELAAAGKLRG